jgi:hypothetical protein
MIDTQTILEAITALVTAANVYMLATVKAAISEQRVWAMERFVSKEDHVRIVAEAIRQSKT